MTITGFIIGHQNIKRHTINKTLYELRNIMWVYGINRTKQESRIIKNLKT